jgi:hypothetical protein
MKKMLHTLLMTAVIFASWPSCAHQSGMQPLPRNAFLRQEYAFMRPDMLYEAKGQAMNETAAAEHIEAKRSQATAQLLVSNGAKVGGVISFVLFLFNYKINREAHQSPHEILLWPLIWSMQYSEVALDMLSFTWKAAKDTYCKTFPTIMDPLGFCVVELLPDQLTAFEVKLMTQWDRFPENKRLQLGNMVFDLRRGHVQDTTASFAALSNALSLPTTAKELVYNPTILNETLKGLEPSLISSLKATAIRHYRQSSAKAGRKTSLFFEGPQGTGKTAAARNLAKSLGLDFCEINYSDPQSSLMGSDKAMGKIAECMIQTKATNPVIILNEVDRGLSPAALAELLILSDPNQTELTDNFLGISIPLNRVMIIYAVNNPIPDDAFQDRVRALRFNGFSLDYRMEYASGLYLSQLLEQYPDLNITQEEMLPLVKNWGQALNTTEREANITLGSMRAVEKSVDDIFFKLDVEKYENKPLQEEVSSLAPEQTESPVDKKDEL